MRLALTLVLILSVALPASAAAEQPEPPKVLGFASEDPISDFSAFEGATGRHPAVYQAFADLDGGGKANLPNLLELAYGLGSTPYIEVTTPQFEAFMRGDLDNDLDAFVANVLGVLEGHPERRLLIAPLPEFNLPDHPWGFQPEVFGRAYRKVRAAFVSGGATPDRVRFVLAYNGGKSGGIDYREYYPGDEFVDIVGFSKINRNNPWKDYDAAFGRFIDDFSSELTSTKPILATQTASVDEDGDRDAWVRDMFRNLGAHDQVIGAIYFNRQKFETGKDNDYRLIADGRVDPVLVAEQRAWSDPGAIEWIFDGRMDAWVEARSASVDEPFLDTAGSVFVGDIDWLAGNGITKGCQPRYFCPDDPVTRGQMAAFLVRALRLPASNSDPFRDDNSSVFEPDIAAMASAGLTSGCAATSYCPESHVTRGEMAAFLHRAFPQARSVRQATEFVDTKGSVFADDIEWLSQVGITDGCDATRFCPGGLVTRGQMAAFLRRALAVD